MEEIKGITCVDNPCAYLVRTKGYSEQFSEFSRAQKAFAKEKSKKIRAEETFKIDLLSKQTGTNKWELIDQVKIGEDYYEE
jgi:hypothetical protein